MEAVKLVLFSDLHLDASFTWVGADRDVARQWRQALRETLIAIVKLAYDEGADALLCSGDLYEHDRFTPDTAVFLRNEFANCAPLPIYLAPGNHDFYGSRSLYQTTDWSANVHIFRSRRLEPVEIEQGITLWGGAHGAPAGTDNFLDRFDVAGRSGVNLALFHGTELGWLADQQEAKQPHASFRADEVRRAGLDHAFLGHLHAPRHAAHHTYPGNPNPLTFGERGRRGAVVATVHADGTVERQTHDVAVSRLHDVSVDVSGCATQQDVRDKVVAALARCDGLARVTLTGELAVEVDLRPADLCRPPANIGALVVRADGISVAYDLEAIALEPTVRGQFVRDVGADEMPDDERRRVLVTGLRALDGRHDLEVV